MKKLALVFIAVALAAGTGRAGVFTVTTTADSGPGSLRTAITSANVMPGPPHTISFAILPAMGLKTIGVASPLPPINQWVIIDGYSQPGSSANTLSNGCNAVPLIGLSGAAILPPGPPYHGLELNSSNCVVRGLIITRWGEGIVVRGRGHHIEGNFIGHTGVEFPAAVPNGLGIRLNESIGVTIGGTEPAARNIISGNTNHGILIQNGGGHVIQGNYIGTHKTGGLMLSNSLNGILIENSDNNLIGGSEPGARNLISGNLSNGVMIVMTSPGPIPFGTSNRVEGNFIGTDITGTIKVPNYRHGVVLSNAPFNRIGSTNALGGNLISGNDEDGLFIVGTRSSNNIVEGNFIGSDVWGTNRLSNSGAGIRIEGAPGNLIGGTNPGAPNLISGNAYEGVWVNAAGAAGNRVQGNFIGTTADGSAPLYNAYRGIFVEHAPGTLISGNLISGNQGGGVHVAGFPGDDAPGTRLEGNFIGTDGTGTKPVGNGNVGVLINSSRVTVGGIDPGAGNRIAFHPAAGVVVGVATSHGNAILGNSIFQNEKLGIDLGASFEDDVTLNDPGDTDTGGNGLQNFPVLTAIDHKYVQGTLRSAPNTTYRLEFFSSDDADPSGHGEGEIFIGTANVVTDGSGYAGFDVAMDISPVAGKFITATATDPENNTSEFSLAKLVLPPCTTAPSGLVAWWRGEGDGKDVIGGYHATVTGPPGFPPGRVGQAFQFYGVDYFGVVAVPPNPALSPHADSTGESGLTPHPLSIGEMTLQAWVKIPRLPTNGPGEPDRKSHPVHKFSGDYGFEYNLFVAANGDAGFEVSRFGAETFSARGGSFTTNEWHHLAGTYKKSTFVRFYLDGVLINELPNPLFPGSVTLANLFIGQQGTFVGLVDEVALFRRALSAAEIQAVFNAGPAGMCPPVVLFVDGRETGSGVVSAPGGASIELRSAFPDGHIYYTLDGSAPQAGLAYAGPFQVGQTVTIRAIAFSADFSQSAETGPVTVQVGEPPVLLQQPQTRRVALGAGAEFSVSALGAAPLSFQWRKDGTNVPGANAATFAVAAVQAGDAGDFRVVVTNAFGTVTSAVAMLVVLNPAEISAQPMSQSVPPGTNVTFCVTATGAMPFQYQWRLNGLNIPGATNDCFSITNVQVTNGGSYTVVVANEAGAATSDPAVLTVQVAEQQPADDFAARVAIAGNTGTVSGTTTNATREMGEPEHAGKPGGKSVWYTWAPTNNGIVTFDTRGSSFDTLLAIYTGTNFAGFAGIAADEDGGGFLTSLVRFNVTAGTNYHLAIDGFGGASGRFVLHWELEPTPEIIPAITIQPQSIAAPFGGSAMFSVTAEASQPGITYQWLFKGVDINGATNSSFTRTNAQLADVGSYRVRVSHTNNPGRVVESAFASLEIGPAPDLVSYDKMEDLPLAPAGGGGLAPASAPSAGTISLGGSLSQYLDNSNSGTQAGEPNHCGVLAQGRSVWFPVVAASGGIMVIDTAGSQVNTVLAVYRGDRSVLTYATDTNTVVACDIDTNGFGGRVVFTAPPPGANTPFGYNVAVDSVGPRTNSAGGTNLIRLNVRLGRLPVITGVSPDQFVDEGDGVVLSVAATNVVAQGVTNPIPPLTYHWSFDGRPRLGATNTTLPIASAQLSDAGRYAVTVSNIFGVTSAVVRVAVLQSGLGNRVLESGDSTTLGVALASDMACAPAYQWLRDGQAVTGQTNPVMVLHEVTAADAGQYTVLAFTCFGSVTSAVSTVAVAARFRVVLGSHPGAGEFHFPPTASAPCGVVIECATELLGQETPWQPILTNFNPHAGLVLPFTADPGRFYRARLLLTCPPP